MKKTTVELPETLLRRVRRAASEQDTTLKELFQQALRQFLASRERNVKRFRLKDGSFGGGGLVEGVGWEDLRDLSYEGRGT